jgi:hypothetical protein
MSAESYNVMMTTSSSFRHDVYCIATVLGAAIRSDDVARQYRPLGDLVRRVMDAREIGTVRDLAKLLDLEGDEQRRVYGWLKPGARGSYAGTLALLEEAGLLTQAGLEFLTADRREAGAELAAAAKDQAEEVADRLRRERGRPRRAAG